jgi:hypothetical protein
VVGVEVGVVVGVVVGVEVGVEVGVVVEVGVEVGVGVVVGVVPMKLCAACNKLVRNPMYFTVATVADEKFNPQQDVILCEAHKHEKGIKIPSLSPPGGLLDYAWQGEGQT